MVWLEREGEKIEEQEGGRGEEKRKEGGGRGLKRDNVKRVRVCAREIHNFHGKAKCSVNLH